MKELLVVRASFILLLAAVLLFTCAVTCNRCNHDQVPAAAGSNVDSLQWRNLYNDAVSSLRAQVQAFALQQQDLRDSMARAFKARPKNVLEAVTFQTRAKADVPAAGQAEFLVGLDPVDSPSWRHLTPDDLPCTLRQHFTSPYYDADVQIGDSSYMHLQAVDTVAMVWKRVHTGGLFNRRSLLQLDISLANPDAKVTGARAYRVPDPKPKKWAIGLQVGATYDPEEKKAKPYAGIGLSYNPIRF